MIPRTLVLFVVLAGIALGQSYRDGVIVSGPSTSGPTPKAAPTLISSFANPQGSAYASGIDWHNGELWCGSAFNATIYRCDELGNILGSFSVPVPKVRGIAHDGTWLWVAVWSPQTVYQLHPITGAIQNSWTPPFPSASGHPNGIALDPNGTELIVSDELGSVHWCAKTNGAISKSLALSPNPGSSGPRGLVLIGNSLWAGQQSSPPQVLEYDITTGNMISAFPAPVGIQFQQGVGLGVDSGQYTLWLTGATNSICAEMGYFGKATATWQDLGSALAGTTTPQLDGLGDLSGGSQATLSLTNALSNTVSGLVLGLTAVNAPFYSGTLVPYPNVLLFPIPTGASGMVSLSGTVPATTPSGVSVYAQYWIVDPLGPQGYSASNAVKQTSP